ncbi:hypothetical protein OE88DRAFT_792785 [Heliocybe sulcata]|uniref:Uncharacterized protein n=1 Tax=Heliocybe sulcata TaxID=5364 RepID=A0A5C3MU55_9AGAM|nr:hypothetical protein OE88DRAFT_792785 [Heliocybe sulcata]
MTFGLLGTICLLWLAIHGIHKAILKRIRASILPLPNSSGRSGPTHSPFSSVSVTVQSVYLKVESAGFNPAQERLAALLLQARNSVFRIVVVRLYDAGAVLGVLGLLTALGLLTFVTATTLVSLLSSTPSGLQNVPVYSTKTFVKRASIESHVITSEPAGAGSGGGLITPIVSTLARGLQFLNAGKNDDSGRLVDIPFF